MGPIDDMRLQSVLNRAVCLRKRSDVLAEGENMRVERKRA